MLSSLVSSISPLFLMLPYVNGLNVINLSCLVLSCLVLSCLVLSIESAYYCKDCNRFKVVILVCIGVAKCYPSHI